MGEMGVVQRICPLGHNNNPRSTEGEIPGSARAVNRGVREDFPEEVSLISH